MGIYKAENVFNKPDCLPLKDVLRSWKLVVAQGSCGASIPGGIQNPFGHGPGQPAQADPV